MNAARFEKSERLQRVYQALSNSVIPLSTRDIIEKAHVCAVNSCVSELRQQGFPIGCVRKGDYWYYFLKSTEGAEHAHG